MLNNPYIAGNPVGKTQAFIGREDILREVVGVVKNPNQHAITLYGQRRIGKTSILQYLAAHLPQMGGYKPIYFDLQDKAAMTLARVLEELARTIAFAYGSPAPNLGEDVETAFRSIWLPELIQNLTEEDKLVLLFDEFDILADPRGDQAIKAFFPYLRSLLELDLDSLKFVFVLGRRIDDLDSIALSVFKGISAYRVSLLTRKDTDLLARIAERNKSLSWTDEALDCLWELTHGHPYLTQQLCSQLWDALYADSPEVIPNVMKKTIEDSVQKTLDASRNALEWIWNGLPPAERVVISALAEAGFGTISQERLEEVLHNSGVRVLIRELRDAPALLTEWDLIELDHDGNGYIFRVELLRRWLVSNKPLRRVQDELDRLIPVADGFYQAAQGIYTQGDFDSAAGLLRQAVAQNPNHLRANELLSEILITQNAWDEARKLLERLYEINPSSARPRLAQVLAAQVDGIQDTAERLKIYDRILELEPRRYASLREAAEKIRLDLHTRELAVEQQNKLSELYQRALGALNSNDPVTARRLFAEVVGINPEYEQASNYLNKAVRGIDALELQARYRRMFRRFTVGLVLGFLLLIFVSGVALNYQSKYKDAQYYADYYDDDKKQISDLATWAAPAIAVATETQLAETYGLISTLKVPEGVHVTSVAYSSDGTMLAVGSDDSMVRVWNISNGNDTSTTSVKLFTSSVTSVAFSPANKNLLAIGLNDNTASLWNVSDDTLIKLQGHTADVTSICFSVDGKVLATGSDDGTVRLWNVANGKWTKQLNIHTSGVTSVAFSPTNRNLVAIGMADKTARLWTVDNNGGATLILHTLKGHTGTVTSVAFSSDGKILATGSADYTVRLWNISDDSLIREIRDNYSYNEITSVAFSPDGTMLSTGYSYYSYSPGGVYLWSISDGSMIQKIEGHTNAVTSVTFSPNGLDIATGSKDGTIRIWRVK